MCAGNRPTPWLIVSLLLSGGVLPGATGDVVSLARDPAPSPDGKLLAFAWAGDVWVVPIEGGAARRLTVNPADDGGPVWSPDGRQIAFASDRHGSNSVFLMTRDGADVRRLTFADRPETPSGWSPDGQFIYYHSRKAGETVSEARVWRVPASGGQSTRVMECLASHAVVSPAGGALVFSRGWSPLARTGYRGSANHDLWLRELESGKFRQLTTFDGTDALPQWDGAGRGVYFLSDRDGNHNVWYQPLGDGAPVAITACAGERVRDFGVSYDGRTLVYAQWDKLFALALPETPGGGPLAAARELTIEAADDSASKLIDLRSFTRDADECEVSPDGKEIALVVRGEIYVVKSEPDKPTRRVTESAARDRSVTWSPDGKALYFVSDRDGYESIYRARSAETPARALSDSLRFQSERVTSDARTDRAPAISPDGKLLAFVRERGDLIIRDLKSGAERAFLTGWSAPVARWSPDSKWLAYEVEDSEFNADIWVAPVDGSAAPVNLSRHPDNDSNPQWSADGQIVAFASRRTGADNDLHFVFLARELDEKSTFDLNEYFEKAAERVKKRKPPGECVASGEIRLGAPPASQPTTGTASSTATASGAAAPPATAPASQPGIEDQLRTLLREFIKDPEKDKKEKKDEKKDDEKPAEYAYDLGSAWKRIRRIAALPEDQVSFALNPDGASVSFVSSHEGAAGLFAVKWNGEDRKKSLAASVGGLHWTLDGQRLFYLKSGVPGSSKDGGGDAKEHAFTAKMAIVRAEEAAQKWDDAARALGTGFYHPTLKGLDWPGLSAKYRELALRTVTWDEFNAVFELFQGLLNGSHLGISGPQRGGNESVGYLGCEFERDFGGAGLRIASILPLSPADRAESKLYVGDVLLKVNGRPVGAGASLDQALINSVGDQLIIELAPSAAREAAEAAAKAKKPAPEAKQADEGATVKPAGAAPASQGVVSRPGSEVAGGAESEPPRASSTGSGASTASAASSASSQAATREVVIRPISYAAYAALAYQAWVEANTRMVEERSGGKVAYLHISGMAEPQFHTFERDLYAIAHGKEALILDVRNNGGGWTADWVMNVLSVKRHAYTIARGGEPGYPQDRLIFYAWTRPTVMMCNQYSYSNAEIVSHAFKTLRRGPLVGTPTFGAVISTGAYSLIDGTTVRMPFRGWYLPDGTDMEGHGAVPDVLVPQTPEDEEAGGFAQLEAAVQAALDEVAKAGAATRPGGGN